MGLTEKAFKNGSSAPPLNEGKLRLYSMRFCPFAQRTRMVLAHKGISHETVNIDLRNKPDWFLKKAPLGLVPVLEQDDKIVYESDICDDYLDELYEANQLTPKDLYAKARQKMLMQIYASKVIPKFYGAMRAKNPDDKSENLKKLLEGLKIFEDVLEQDFFGGVQVSMLDIHIWPWLERIDALQKAGLLKLRDQFPKLNGYIQRMYQTKAVQETMFDEKTHLIFFEGYRNKRIDYDYGLGKCLSKL